MPLFDRTIELRELTTDRVLRVEEGEQQRDTPRWSPDSRRLAFRAGTDQEMHLWLWTRASERVSKVADVPLVRARACGGFPTIGAC